MGQEYKTLRVPEADYEQAKASKKSKETWGEFLQRCSNNPPEIREFVERSNQTVELEATTVNDIADEVERRLGR